MSIDLFHIQLSISLLSSFLRIFLIPFSQRILYIIQVSLNHLNPTPVVHLRLHLSICSIRHPFWFSMSCNNQSFTIQMFSPHKCGQESGYSTFNAETATFPQIFCAFPHSFQIRKTHPPLLNFLEGSSSCWDINLRYASHIREYFPPQTFLHVLFTYEALCWTFTIYQQSPRTFYCPRIGPWPNILFWALTPTIIIHQLTLSWTLDL